MHYILQESVPAAADPRPGMDMACPLWADIAEDFGPDAAGDLMTMAEAWTKDTGNACRVIRVID